MLAGTLGLAIVFALLFRDYGVRNFVHQGVTCLAAGLGFAIPAALLVCLLLARGFVLNYRAAGLCAGTLAGLAGIGVLELHCPILNAPHVMVWHVAVVLMSGIAGWLLGWSLQALRHRRSLRISRA